MNNSLSYIEKYKLINNISKLKDNIDLLKFPNIIMEVEDDFKILDSLIKKIDNDQYIIESNNFIIN